MKDSGNGVREFQFSTPIKKTKWQACKDAIYDPQTKELFGRTGKSWGQLLLFYTIFYIVLAALFAICMQGLLATISDKEPKWQLDSSIIGTNPGLGFRPISKRTEEGSLIWYDPNNEESVQKWTGLLDEFLAPYRDNQTGENFVNCDFDNPPKDNKVCITDLDKFGDCSPSNFYGYKTSSPCIFLKLNRIFGWKADYYKQPIADMPTDLNETIATLSGTQTEQIWVSCRGEGPADRENLQSFNFLPSRGFPGYYYPYRNQDNYMSPLIAVKIVNPKADVIINIECRAWAKNINYNGGNMQREGSIHFEIMVDSKKPENATA